MADLALNAFNAVCSPQLMEIDNASMYELAVEAQGKVGSQPNWAAVIATEKEAIARANDTECGLIAYLHSLDPRRIYHDSRALQFGMVAANRTKVTGAPIPFGGTKQSGLGREGARLGMEEFTRIKYVCRDWREEKDNAAQRSTGGMGSRKLLSCFNPPGAICAG